MKPTFFKTKADVRKWLEKNHETKTELWIGYYKKASGKIGATNEEVLDEMLCFGWIDGIRKAIDEVSYCNRYTPRKAKSKWSKINTEKVKRLIDAGLMTSAGLKVIEEAKADGRWDAAYDSAKTAKVPEEFLNALKKNKKASAFYKKLNKQDLFSITFRLQNARKAETKEKWIQKIIEMLANGEKFSLYEKKKSRNT